MFLKLLEIYSLLKEGKFLIDLKNLFSREKGIVIAFLVLFACIYSLFNILTDNKEFNNFSKINSLSRFVSKTLETCGNGSGISISSISTEKLKKGDYQQIEFHKGEFVIARACDTNYQKSHSLNDCVLDLTKLKEFYKMVFELDQSSYLLFKKIGSFNEIRTFILRNKDKQDISETEEFKAVNNILKNLDWYDLDVLDELKIVAIIDYKQNVVYVITFLTNTSFNSSIECSADNILYKLKEKLYD